MKKSLLLICLSLLFIGAGCSTTLPVPNIQQNAGEYRNTQYGFSFSLPKPWEGYTVITDTWKGDIPNGPHVEQGPLISLRHPAWTTENQRQDIPIMVFTLDQWNALQEEKFHIGAAPINPQELGRNTRYVFALPARYDYAFPTGVEEVEHILEGHPLHAF